MTMTGYRRVMVAVAVGILVMGLAGLAVADVPSGRPETCTMERVANGDTCELCGGAYHGDRDFCVRHYEGRAFERRCRTQGASTWNEIWCAVSDDSAVDETNTTNTDEQAVATNLQAGEDTSSTRSGRSRNCSVGSGSGALAGLSLLALFAVKRRRQR